MPEVIFSIWIFLCMSVISHQWGACVLPSTLLFCYDIFAIHRGWLRRLSNTARHLSHSRTLQPPLHPLFIFWCSSPPPLRSQTVHSAERQCHQAYLVIIFILTVLMFLLTLTSDVLVSQMGLCPPETVSLNRVQKISSPPPPHTPPGVGQIVASNYS